MIEMETRSLHTDHSVRGVCDGIRVLHSTHQCKTVSSSLLSFGEVLSRSTFIEADTSEPPDCLKCCRCESAAHDVEGCNLELSFSETNGTFRRMPVEINSNKLFGVHGHRDQRIFGGHT